MDIINNSPEREIVLHIDVCPFHCRSKSGISKLRSGKTPGFGDVFPVPEKMDT